MPVTKETPQGGLVRLTRIHLEEDTGKLTHGAGAFSEVDLNRAGIPLLEIVSEPDLRSPQAARACLEELRLTLRYLGVSDCEMQEGSLRCDANVNLHIPTPSGTVATPIVEIKNLNSFRSVERALTYEAGRQYARWQADGKTIADAFKETRGWSDPEGVTKPQRQKETAADYRYFPEPDLVPVVVDDAWVARVRSTIGELPGARRKRFETDYGLSGLRCQRAGRAGRGGRQLLRRGRPRHGRVKAVEQLGAAGHPPRRQGPGRLAGRVPRPSRGLADLIHRVKRKELNTNQGREVLEKMIATGEPASAVIAAGGYGMVSDEGAIAAAVDAALAPTPRRSTTCVTARRSPTP